jgi:hypothetical protein
VELKEPEREVEHDVTFDDSGKLVLKKKINVNRGAKSKSAGNQFEARVRKDLDEKGWIVDKWTNNLDLEKKKVCPAKRVFNPFKKVMTIGTGFPDFIAFQKMDGNYKIIGVEVKMNNTLSKIEKEKCALYLKKNIFNEVWIASKRKEKNRIKIIYENFSDKYSKFLL